MTNRGASIALCAFFLAACGQRTPDARPLAPAPASESGTGVDMAQLPFVGKVWMTADFGTPRGSMRIFLPNGTMLMDSCFETYRVQEWVPRSATRIAWREDISPVEADVEQPGPKDLVLRLQLGNEVREERYMLATVPYICPDMPR